MVRRKENKKFNLIKLIGLLLFACGMFMIVYNYSTNVKLDENNDTKIEEFFDDDNTSQVEEPKEDKQENTTTSKVTNYNYIAILEIPSINLKRGLVDPNSKYNNVNYINIKESMKQANNLILVVKILMYGFISLVTLIGVTSVFNTISTSMALRKREFAILRSIGLTRGGFNKMLFFESLFFGMKSLIFALPVSIGVTILIHYSLADMVSISTIIIPWKAIIISIVSVFIIVLLTMMYSSSKIKKHNIIEQIREENI